MLHFNATITAQEAQDANLVSRVFPSDQLESLAFERIKQMAQWPLPVRMMMNEHSLIDL
jgi:enoyl-CoA hydratase/carnithine racemase